MINSMLNQLHTLTFPLHFQARTHQLLVHNKELLEHIQALVLQVRELELKMAGSGNVMPTMQLLPSPPEMKSQVSLEIL